MQTLEGLKRSIQSIQELQSVVRTMKVMAAVGIRQYEQAVASLEQYDRTIEMGLQVVLTTAPELPAQSSGAGRRHEPVTGALVLGSDQGMVGQFNDQIASFAAEQLPREMDPEAIVAVGQRTAVKLEDQGMQVRLTLPVPGSVSGINWTVQELLLETDRLRSQGVEQIMIFHHRPLSGASYRPQRQILFPASREWLRELAGRKWESRSLPIYRMETDELFISLMRQHYYVMLFRAVAESLASENASRLSSMQAAEKNIEERLSELGTRYHRQRQAAVTSELLDIVAGFESLSGP